MPAWLMVRAGLALIALGALFSAIPQYAGLAAITPSYRITTTGLRVLCQGILLLPLAWLLLTRGPAQRPIQRITDVFLFGFIAAYPHFPPPFFDYIWDVFLIESIFVFFLGEALAAMPRLRRFEQWPLRLLLFKLMICMGIVKFLHGMPEWRNGTAMQYFWANQPMPGYLAWYAALLPDWVQRLMCVFVFLIEVPGPFMIFAGPSARKIYFWLNLVFQAGIFVSGNYGFFNLLTVVVSFSLWEKPRATANLPAMRRDLRAAAWSAQLVLGTWLFCGFWYIQRSVFPGRSYLHETSWIFLDNGAQGDMFAPTRYLLQLHAAAKTANPYALFGIIPKYRLEVALEASRDGQQWEKFRFKVRPDEPNRAPVWYAPHHWRLDHQMYYESFRIRDEAMHERFSYFLGVRWIDSLERQIFAGNPAVLKLFASVPVAPQELKFLRFSHLYYQFTTREEFRQTGNYWKTVAPHAGQFSEKLMTRP